MDELIRQYFDLLVRWNRRINLTAIKDWEEFQQKHIADSLELLPFLDGAKNILDIGTGAGIPGIILKIERPELEVTLLDSTRKKISFCDEAIRQLGLKGIRAVWGRAEDPKIVQSLGQFDLVVSRAAWGLSEFLGVAAPYVANGKRLIAMKGLRWKEELDDAQGAMSRHSFELVSSHSYRLAGGESRCIMIFAVRHP